MPKNKAPQPKPYDTSTSREWLDKVNSWPWTPVGVKKWKKTGQCPRCKHPMSSTVTPVTILAVRDKVDSGGFEVPSAVYIECNCGMPHPGRPENESGCGPAGYFSGPLAGEASAVTAEEVEM